MTMFIEIFIFNLDDLFSCAHLWAKVVFRSTKVWDFPIIFFPVRSGYTLSFSDPHAADYIGYVVAFHPGKWPWIFLVALQKQFFTLFYLRRSRSQSCPFCRDSLKRVNSGDLWVYMDNKDVVDMSTITRENLRRLFIFIDKLPLIVPDNMFDHYDTHIR